VFILRPTAKNTVIAFDSNKVSENRKRNSDISNNILNTSTNLVAVAGKAFRCSPLWPQALRTFHGALSVAAETLSYPTRPHQSKPLVSTHRQTCRHLHLHIHQGSAALPTTLKTYSLLAECVDLELLNLLWAPSSSAASVTSPMRSSLP
jgi:hypothetical protein